MRFVFWGAFGVLVTAVVLAIALAAYSRLKPLPAERFTARPGPQERGQHRLEGGAKYVLPIGQLPKNGSEDGIATLVQIIRETPRTRSVEVQDGFAFVTRSRGFGFPDITRVWEADGHLHIHSHLVIGRSDLGVNAARIDSWIKQLFNQSR